MTPIVENHPILASFLMLLLAAVLFLTSNFRELFIKEDEEEVKGAQEDLSSK